MWETDQLWKESDLDTEPTAVDIADQNNQPAEPEKTELPEEPMAMPETLEKPEHPEAEASSGSRVSWINCLAVYISIYVLKYTYVIYMTPFIYNIHV